MLGKGNLQEFVVLYEFVIRAGLPTDAGGGNAAGENELGELTGKGTRCRFLNLFEIQLQEIVKEIQQLFATRKVRSVHHAC